MTIHAYEFAYPSLSLLQDLQSILMFQRQELFFDLDPGLRVNVKIVCLWRHLWHNCLPGISPYCLSNLLQPFKDISFSVVLTCFTWEFWGSQQTLNLWWNLFSKYIWWFIKKVSVFFQDYSLQNESLNTQNDQETALLTWCDQSHYYNWQSSLLGAHSDFLLDISSFLHWLI